MNSVNKPTRFSPFQLCLGHSPCVLPPLVQLPPAEFQGPSSIAAQTVIDRWIHNVWEAQDNLLKAKISQARQANKSHIGAFPFEVGQHVHLSTLHRHCKCKSKDEKHVVKFMPRFDGPHTIMKIDTEHSTVCYDTLFTFTFTLNT